MGFAHNNVLHANHFRKDWQRRVRTWFEQPGRKLRRRNARKTKAVTLGVRPLTLLRPAVHCQTVRYNRKIRLGRGFTYAELREAGINRREARGIGIVVDHRRRNLSEDGKEMNVKRLAAYKEKLVVFPRKTSKPKKGDSTGDDIQVVSTQFNTRLVNPYTLDAPRAITEEERLFRAYRSLRGARASARYDGARKVRAAKRRRGSKQKEIGYCFL
ncbi:hypothetical protein SERLA73DRAFT_173699 [Serpula lacrymans var. lacrymans S7.3]|uniref:60S ribosomal protein L13 n=2 Tax=Serpula lacrymans var. lacrymans TaxID=341189 RepID=F8PFS6_SERL3|nr:uncharacterized protein SERLADRAFT_454528 [Serpula lacrymans var. lacrymans S7.9]EGO04277.1 hypothetical protein SERLA73DRAFT_173699 [Serpula lacrymans var. lacrymans S7.3]EGO30210.1 hypothetical protein SERLADRAFT_454528 [Serpula lacrymans var. lacrymans S7.9]